MKTHHSLQYPVSSICRLFIQAASGQGITYYLGVCRKPNVAGSGDACKNAAVCAKNSSNYYSAGKKYIYI